jgi:hypothetical protein
MSSASSSSSSSSDVLKSSKPKTNKFHLKVSEYQCTQKRESIEKYLLREQKFKGIAYRDKISITYTSDLLLLRLFNDLTNFELTGIGDHSKNDKIKDKHESLSESINDIMAVMRELIDWFLNDDEDVVDGFTNGGEEKIARPLPKITHDEKRKLIIYVWGRKKRKFLHHKVDHNFNAAVLHGRKEGIRNAVRKCPDYNHFIQVMVNTIEKKDCHIVGVNCRAGRHRSVTCAWDLLNEYYPDSEIVYMEI